MSASPCSAAEILQREFLEIRAKVLELAAALDRLQRADGSVVGDVRMDRVREGIELLLEDRPDRAEQVQLTFSRQYDSGWQSSFAIKPK
jgi:hypothetical protein